MKNSSARLNRPCVRSVGCPAEPRSRNRAESNGTASTVWFAGSETRRGQANAGGMTMSSGDPPQDTAVAERTDRLRVVAVEAWEGEQIDGR